MTSAIGTPPQTDSSCGSGEHDLVSMGSMVQFHQKMVKDAEEQKPFVAIVARLIAKLVDNNDKAREVLQLVRVIVSGYVPASRDLQVSAFRC
jgi:hypothetical protein